MATSFLGVPRAHVTAPWSRPLPFGATRELGNHHRIQRPDQPNIGPVYNSLQWDRREIRLIHIKPASNLDEPLECQLVAVSLDNNPRYGALSYTWGDARDTVTIKVHGYPMKITKNLAEALVEFRSRQGIWCLDDGKPQKPLHYLWADAICIDQEDVVERNHQVGIMYQIYSRAAVVISWLHSPWKGPSFRWGDGVLTDIILTFQMLKRLESQVSTHTMYWIDAKHDRDVLLGWTKEDVSLDGRVITPGESPALWKALATFCGHPYFTRLWIIQEVAAARRHIFWTQDNASVKGTLLKLFLEWVIVVLDLGEAPSWVSPESKSWLEPRLLISRLEKWYDLKERFHSSKQYDFYKAVQLGIAFHTSEPQDKVFALCSRTGGMTVDYTMTVKQVFSRLHEQYMRQMDIPLKFLAFAGDRRCTPNPHRLPSWLPDYSTEAQHWPSGCLKRDLYMADKGMRTVSRIKADEVLLVTGCECDMITRVESRKIFVEPRFEAFYRDYAEHADRSLMYPTGITKFQAFVRTLFFDMIDSRTPCRMDALDFETQARMVGLLILNFDYREQVDIESEELRTELFRNALTVLFSEQDLMQLGEQIDKTVERMKSVFMNSSFVKRILRAKRPSRRRLFHTKHGYIGLGPKDASIGDKVCVVGGSPMPILLRKLEDRYEHVGTCFVLGYMDGEVGKLITEGKLVEREFEIV